MRVLTLALLLALSTACSVTIRLGNMANENDIPAPKARPAAVVAPSPVSGPSSPIVKAPAKKSTKKATKKPTAEVCAAKRAEADKCDAEVKVETCKAACEPPPAPAAPVQ